MNNEIFYVIADNSIVTRNEIEMAFYVTHGYHHTTNNEKEFLEWLHSLLGKTIKEVIPESRIEVEKLAQSRPILAMQLYRERKGCRLRDAREYVESLKKS